MSAADSELDNSEACRRFKARVTAQVERIAQSQSLSKAALPLQMLQYVVGETLAGREGELKEYTVGAFGLGLGDGFDPGAKNTVRQVAGQLRAKLDQYYRANNPDDLVIIEVPAGGYVPKFREIDTSTRRSSSRRAVELFEAGQRIWQQDRSPAGVQRAITCLEQATVHDPGYANAHGALAEALVFKVVAGERPEAAMPRAQEAITKSLAIDDLNANAHAIQGAILSFYRWQWDAADRAFRRALELNAGSLAVHAWYANYLVARCRLAEAIVEAEAILDRGPGLLVAMAHALSLL